MPAFNFFEQVPAVLYPWGSDVYSARLSECIVRYGISDAGRYCTDLIAWHAVLHLVSALVVVWMIRTLRHRSSVAAYTMSVAFVVLVLFIEFVDQPMRLHEVVFKSVLDSVTWLTPLLIYWPVQLFRQRQ